METEEYIYGSLVADKGWSSQCLGQHGLQVCCKPVYAMECHPAPKQRRKGRKRREEKIERGREEITQTAFYSISL